jgi:hypothetical protein
MRQYQIIDADENVAFISDNDAWDLAFLRRYTTEQAHSPEAVPHMLTDQEWQRMVDLVHAAPIMHALLHQIRDAVGDLPNAINADLETGSHHRNNAAAEEFSRKHRYLLKKINDLAELADRVPEISGEEVTT